MSKLLFNQLTEHSSIVGKPAIFVPYSSVTLTSYLNTWVSRNLWLNFQVVFQLN